MRFIGSRHGPDHPRDLLEHFADLLFAHDQGWRQRDRIAGGPDKQALVVERPRHCLIGAPADRVRVAQMLQYWRTDPELAGVREPGLNVLS